MSTTIDERVVEMRFDNKKFESNIKTSINSLNDLKDSLDMSDAKDSFSELEKYGNKVSFGGLASALENISSKFTALGVVGVTALQNITNKAINAVEALVK